MQEYFQGGMKLGRLAIVFATVLTLAMPGVIYAACGTAPDISIDATEKDVLSGDSVDYTVTLTNNAAGSCTFDLSTSGDSANFSSAVSGATLTIATNGASDTFTVTVTDDTGQAIGTTNSTTITVDSVDNIVTTTVNNPLLHNSFNLGSTKWAGSGGWGLTGTEYGSITCSTCHARNTGNIKRVRNSISAASGAFPGDAQPVDFQTVTDGSSDFGDDTGGHATSNRVCEVCHSITKYHRYDTATQVADGGTLTHFNNKDCTSCHAHSEGFKAGACDGCHGGGTSGAGGNNFWPDGSNANLENDEPGRHEEHMSALAQLVYGLADSTALLNDPAADSKQTDLCAYCHDNPGGDADHSATMPAEVSFHPVWDVVAAGGSAYTAGDNTCTNNCHNGKATGTGTYGWADAGTSACIMCHNDVTADGNTTGETHNDHMNAATKFGRTIVCADCHDAATAWATTAPASNHINGTLNVSGNVTLSYTGAVPTATTFAGCGTNSCHSNGEAGPGAPVNNTYAWDDNNLDDCGICHLGAPDTNNHPSHNDTAEDAYGSTANASWSVYDNDVADTTGYDFGCGNCHGDTLGDHLNGTRNVSGTGWGSGTCSATYCHSYKDHDGVTTLYNSPPLWTSAGFSGPDDCAECHHNSPISSGHEEHQVGFHYAAVYSGKREFLPVLNSDPLPANLNTATLGGAIDEPYDTLRGHGGLLDAAGNVSSTTMTCYVCHNSTVTDKGNDLNPVCASCHDGTKTPLQGTLTIANTNFHVNGAPNVVFMAEKVRSKAQVRDDLADVPEIANNWTRQGGYKSRFGTSYDESPDTLANMAATYGGWVTVDTPRATLPDGTQPARTCMISCHLWEDNRVDKYPVHWEINSIHGSQPIMCIDCHTRLPK